MSLGIITTMSPRHELHFIKDWLDYHTKIVDKILIFYDPCVLEDGKRYASSAVCDIYKSEVDLSFEIPYPEVLEQFKNICLSYDKVEFRAGIFATQHINTQAFNLLLGSSKIDCDYFFHIDGDEFVNIQDYSVFDYKNHIGISQIIMDARCQNKINIPVVEIHKCKKVPRRIWKTCFLQSKFLDDANNLEELKAGGFIHGFTFRPKKAFLNQIKLYHFSGWSCLKKFFVGDVEVSEDFEFRDHFQKIKAGQHTRLF